MISHVSAVPAQRTHGVPAGSAAGGAAGSAPGGDVGAVPAVSAVERYKELVGLAAESVDRMRARDRDRVGAIAGWPRRRSGWSRSSSGRS
ncbi:hypothetical protein K7G98_03345 [Saccharothrix sp. MB29]|nr:hypothetical protein [Saccharothrix sp. MB29]